MDLLRTEQQVPDWLHRRATDAPSVAALESHGETVTYAALLDTAKALAGMLRSMQVQAGDRIALLCKRGLVFAKGLHGIMQSGAVAVPLNIRLTPVELAWQVRDAGVKVLLHDSAFLDVAQTLQIDIGQGLLLVNVEELAEHATSLDAEHVEKLYIDLTEPLAVMYTSGTTGNPKGALISYGNQWWSAVNSAIQLGLDRQERWLVPMPLFHMGGISVLMRSVIYGTTAVIQDSFDPEAVNRSIEKEKITVISVVPVMLQRMLEHRTAPYPDTLRCILLGGSAATKGLLERCQALRVPVAQSYGLTEANSQVTTLRPDEGLRKLGSSGKPLLTTEVAILAEGSLAGANQPGEIIVRGPTIIPGYLNRPDATEAAMKDGWFKTGDVGYLDEEGYLFVLDRRNDMIVSGGENVYPAEIESVLSLHPEVLEVGVAGRPDETWGQVPVAFLKVSNPTADLMRELEQFCRSRLAGYKVPKAFVFVDDLPRNASGKLMRRKLREWLNHKQQQD